MKSTILAGLAVTTLALIQAAPASAQVEFLGIEGSTSRLWKVDEATGSCSIPRPLYVNSMAGIAAAPDGTLYGLTTFASTPANSLITIDPVTGATSTVGATGLGSIYEGDLAVDPTTGSLYGIQDYPGTGGVWMFRINRSSGAAMLIGEVVATVCDLSAMGFDAAGTCYVIDCSSDVIHRVDKTTAAVLSTAPLSTPLGNTAGMAFHPITGVLYVADGGGLGTKKLYTCVPSTGVLTEVGDLNNSDGMAGITFRCFIQASATFRNDSGGTNPTGFVAGPPVLGTTWSASVDNTGMGNSWAGIVGYFNPTEVFLPGIGDYLLVNVASGNGELLGLSPRAGTGVIGFSASVPGDMALGGYTFTTQGYGFGGGGGIHLHNAYDLWVGTY